MDLLSFLNQGFPENVWDFDKSYLLRNKTLSFISSGGETIFSAKILKVNVDSCSTFRLATFKIIVDKLQELKHLEVYATTSCNPQFFVGGYIFLGRIEILEE